jgi:tRNA threonylcarbamoyladenosine biosynthesis protein TsaE
VNGAHRRDAGAQLEAPSTRASLAVPTAADMRDLGATLARLLRAGDLVVLSGDLGAGKTTLTQGIGQGMRVRGDVTSPTFVIARLHPALGQGPALVHVDAYRLGSLAEVDDLDLDASLGDCVTVVEWGTGLVEELAAGRLEITVHRPLGGGADTAGDADEPRTVELTGYGPRWHSVALPG